MDSYKHILEEVGRWKIIGMRKLYLTLKLNQSYSFFCRQVRKLEHLPMDEITSAKITKFVGDLVKFYRSEHYQTSGRGRASRCNLNN